MRARLACLVVLLAVPAAAAAPSAEDSESRRRMLDFGLWNNRIHALYDAGELGADGLPFLSYASDDADWQVRLTAVHFMGKIGAPAAPTLGGIVRVEPCPFVRVSALRWLTGMGPAGRKVLDEVMTPEDESEMESIPDRFGTERMGKPLVIDSPGGSMTTDFFDHGLDLRVCASSEYANRRKRSRASSRTVAAPAIRGEAPARPGSFTPVVTPPVRIAKAAAKKPERLPQAPPGRPPQVIELEAPLPGPKESERPQPDPAIADRAVPGTPETMPEAGPGLPPREPPSSSAGYARAPGPRAAAASAPRAPLPKAEVMPNAPEGFNHPPVERGEAGLVEDAGTGKPENDPVPELIKRLSSSEPRTRARAADELGKRGAAALPAVPALRRALKDGDRRVRASAVLALGGLGSTVDGVAAELRQALRDRNEDVRFSAVIALRRLQAPPKAK
jgi:hypothetical protein